MKTQLTNAPSLSLLLLCASFFPPSPSPFLLSLSHHLTTVNHRLTPLLSRLSIGDHHHSIAQLSIIAPTTTLLLSLSLNPPSLIPTPYPAPHPPSTTPSLSALLLFVPLSPPSLIPPAPTFLSHRPITNNLHHLLSLLTSTLNTNITCSVPPLHFLISHSLSFTDPSTHITTRDHTLISDPAPPPTHSSSLHCTHHSTTDPSFPRSLRLAHHYHCDHRPPSVSHRRHSLS